MQSSVLKSALELSLKKKLNFYQIERTIAEYKENILDYMQTEKVDESNFSREEITYCLNTDVEKSYLDDYVRKRIDFTFQE